MILKKRTREIIKKKLIRKPSSKGGFTLIEILVVIGIIAILATVVLVAINPARQFALARDSQRVSNVNAILNAISQNMAENKGKFMCSNIETILPNVYKVISDTNDDTNISIGGCIIPDYISSLPFDPSKTTAYYTDLAHYNTGYSVIKDNTGRITVTADGEINKAIFVTR